MPVGISDIDVADPSQKTSREAVRNNEGSEIAVLFFRLESIRDPAA